MRVFTGETLVLATHNQGKVEELCKLFDSFSFTIKSAFEFGLSEPKETENTFIGNARVKAHYASRKTGLPCLADDSGIEVESLNGAPGVFTADWAETTSGRDFNQAMQKIWVEVQKTEFQKPYKAQFCCTLVMAWPDGHDEVFEGVTKGCLTWPIKGNNGHGFDPMFIPHGFKETFGEMDRWEKNKISHRGLAFANLIKNCFIKEI